MKHLTPTERRRVTADRILDTLFPRHTSELCEHSRLDMRQTVIASNFHPWTKLRQTCGGCGIRIGRHEEGHIPLTISTINLNDTIRGSYTLYHSQFPIIEATSPP